LRHSQGEGPQPALADLAALYAQVRASGIDLRIDGDRSPFGEPPAAVQLALFRILQEALTNAIRHGAPGPVRVSFAWHVDRVELTVSNPVRARAVNGAASVGHGLIGMRERAQLVGGTLTSDDDSAVFVVRCALPIAMPA
ncbi:MAG: sensor histidine kinase, partial [Actinobacteria bacterium]|nr:sensor histidine kinase [Actinomycetota bacterium]